MPKKAVTVASPLQDNLGQTAGGLPSLPMLNPAAIAAELGRWSVRADNVAGAVSRAVITDEESAGKATQFLAGITSSINDAEEVRKALTGPIDRALKALNSLYTKGPLIKLTLAKESLQLKLGVYVRRAREKAAADAAAQEAAIRAETVAQAAQAFKEGDTVGGKELIQAAATVRVEVEKPVIRGTTTTLSTPRRKVGKITDLRQFLGYVVQNRGPQALNVLGGISVGQRELNQLAAHAFATNDSKSAETDTTIPGFEAYYEEGFNAR